MKMDIINFKHYLKSGIYLRNYAECNETCLYVIATELLY